MGGCATKPKELHGHLPDENPGAPEVLAKSVDIPTSPVPAAEVKVGADGGTAEKETKGEALADVSEPKPEAEPKTEPAVAVVAEEPAAPENSLAGLLEAQQDAPDQSVEEIPDEDKKDLPKLDEKEASTDAVEDKGTQKAVVASDAQAEEKAEVQKASASETTGELKKLDVQPAQAEEKTEVQKAIANETTAEVKKLDVQPAQAEEKAEVQQASASETTGEVKKLDVQPVVEEGSHEVESAAVSSSSSA